MSRQIWPCLVLVLSTLPAIGAESTTDATAEPVTPFDMRRVASKIEPELHGDAARLPQYINFFARELGNDSRICAFEVTAEAGKNQDVALKGFVEFPETHKSLVSFLQLLGFKVEDQLESLPSEKLGAELFGLVKVPHSYSFDRPSGKRKQENDCLLGEPLLLLREQEGQLLNHSREGYLGYLPSGDVLRVDEKTFVEYLKGPRAVVTKDQKKDGKVQIPAGARLKWLSTDGDSVTAELPTKETVKLSKVECRIAGTPAVEIDDIIATAKTRIGVRYFWGGRTSDGIDCSGLVQTSYAAAGLHLPRDAYQQFYLGQMTGTRWFRSGIRRGDTLYFLAADGKIRHTALYIGDDHFIQAVMPHAKISSFNPKDPEYDAVHAESFAFAKRLLD